MARPHRELDATNDKKNKKTGEELMVFNLEEGVKDFWPIYNGKSFNLWEPDTEKYYAHGDPDKLIPYLQTRRERSTSALNAFNDSWKMDVNTLPCFLPRIIFRDIARAKDPRTIISCLAPPNVFLTNKAPFFLFPRGNPKDITYLLGILSSIPLDWYARRIAELGINFFLIKSLPVPRPQKESLLRSRVISLAGRLACNDERFKLWSREIGVEYGPLPQNEKDNMICELDSVVAHLYGLSENQLTQIFETFRIGWDYESRLDETLLHYKDWANKL